MTAVLPVRDNVLTAERLVLDERFHQLPGINNDVGISKNVNFELLGTNAVSADLAFNATGGFDLATHGGATDSAILLPHLDAIQTQWSGVTWLPSKQPTFAAVIKTDAALTNTTIWAGLKLTNTPTIATDNDQVVFKYVNGTDTNWQLTYSVAGTDVTVDTGVVVAVDTQYRVWITVDSARLASCWINGVLVATSTALTASAALIPYVGVLSASNATVKKAIVRWLQCSVAIS